jgi:hypothetical protein
MAGTTATFSLLVGLLLALSGPSNASTSRIARPRRSTGLIPSVAVAFSPNPPSPSVITWRQAAEWDTLAQAVEGGSVCTVQRLRGGGAVELTGENKS